MLRFGLTLFLSVLNILWISLFVYLRLQPEQEEKQKTSSLAIQSHVLDLQSIDLRFNGDKKHYIFEKGISNWHLMKPFQWEANPLTIDRLLKEILALKQEFLLKIDPSTDLSAYGLLMPFCKIKGTSVSHTYDLIFGNVINRKVYVLESETNKIFTTDAHCLEALPSALEQWCSPFLFQFSRLQSIILETSQQKVSLVRENGEWLLKSPVHAVANKQYVEKICQRLIQLELTRFLETDEIQYYLPKFSENTKIYHLTLSDAHTVMKLQLFPFELKKHCYVAQRNHDGYLFILESDVIDQLMNPQETLRDRKLFHFDEKMPLKITYKNFSYAPDKKIILQWLEKNQWEVLVYHDDTFIQSQKASAMDVQQFMSAIDACYVEKFLSEKPDLIDMKRIDLKMQFQDPNAIQMISLFYNSDSAYMKFSNDPTYFKLAFLDETLLYKKFEDFIDKTVWEWKSDERLIQLQLKSLSQNTIREVDIKQLGKNPLPYLKVDRWLENDLTYPLSSPIAYLLFIKTEDKLHTVRTYELKFTKRTSGSLQSGCYLDKKFTFPPEWIDFLSRLTH